MNSALVIVVFMFLSSIHQIWKTECLKKVSMLKSQMTKNGIWKLPIVSSSRNRKKKYANCNVHIFKRIKKPIKHYAFQDLVYSNKKKKIVNLIYLDIINKDKEKITEKLKRIVQKQERLNFPLHFSESIHYFHTNFMYYCMLQKILILNPYILSILKKVHKIFCHKFNMNILNKIIFNISMFEKKYIWNQVKIDRLFINMLKKHHRKIRTQIDDFLKKNEYYCYIMEKNGYIKRSTIDDSQLSSALSNIYGVQFYHLFEEHFFKKSINTIMKLINTNVQFILLKTFISDRYSAQQILYTYKTFFTLTIQKNTIAIFSPFVETEQMKKNLSNILDETVKRQLNVDIPNLKMMNMINLCFIMTNLLLNKLIQMLFYLIMLYIKKKIHQGGGGGLFMRVLNSLSFG
ncbi:hypothetical protein, conserved [Plasmodium gonderi]|uniref:Uncharacterized protein n=1 Tax=Plasmodium gonderi TaxID=77519 RepID=A0A1Y1JB72_PLAGO|nr:hypothetical protein, conserved [Plasmodium gonderi]GAW79500.1 hypothetical protein, conserved [Plasmodium gonderi]